MKTTTSEMKKYTECVNDGLDSADKVSELENSNRNYVK